ncbi:MAG: restriction endonuclease subunit S, partial [Cellulomonadaceae bacterium]
MSALPDGWKMARLEDVAAWSSGGTPKARTSAYYGGNIPWAVIGDLNDAVVTTTAGTITEAGLANSSAKWVPRDSVLVAMYGSIGKLGISGTPLATNQAIAAARPNRSVVEMRYLFYYLMSQRSALSRAGKGAAQQNIGQGILKAWTIPLPPLAEQGRIVEVLEEHLSRLDTADSLLQSSSRRSAVLDESAIVQILGIGSRTQSIVEDDLPMLPAGWRWSTLSDVAEVVGGVTKDAKKEGTPGLVEVPYLRVANVQRGRLDLTNIATIRVAPAKAAALKLRAGDILMNEGGDRDKLARGWIWEDQIPGCIHQNHVFRARSLGEVRPEWLACCANSYGSRCAQR